MRTSLKTLLCAATLCAAAAPAHADWTQWIDRDGPGGSGDWETLNSMRNEGRIADCDDVVAIEGRRTSDGLDATLTGETLTFNTNAGLICKKADQADGACDDYEVRVYCAGVESYHLTGITHAFDGIGLSDEAQSDGLLFAQTTSHKGGDAGNIRLNGNQLKFQESDAGSHTGEDVDVIAFLGDLESMGLTGESGQFDVTPSSRSDVYAIDFAGTYENPVLFAQVATYGGSDPIIALPIGVYDTGAVLGVMEPIGYDGSHATETIHWVVMEAGRYALPNGQFADIGIKDMQTFSYDVAGMEALRPQTRDDGGLFMHASVFTQPQVTPIAEYVGTRVIKNVGPDGTLIDLKLRHMRRRAVEYAANPPTTGGWIGYMVFGTESPVAINRDADGQPVTHVPTGMNQSNVSQGGQNTTNATCGNVSDVEENLFDQSDDWGNSTVGADYSVVVGMSDTRADGGDVWIGGTADANVTLLDDEFTVFDIGAEATTDSDGVNSNGVWLVALNQTIYDESAQLTYSPDPYSITFFEASAYFYGVKVTGSAVGELGVEATATLGATGVTLSAEPYAALLAEASASIGGWCLSASITAALTLVEAAVPVVGSLNLVGDAVQWDLDADLVLSSLDGSLKLKLKYCVGSKSWELFSFTGFEETYDLLDESGCL